MTKTDQIRAHLMNRKAITPLQALRKYGCMRLAARVSDLRAEGLEIRSTIIKQNGKRFARYRLAA